MAGVSEALEFAPVHSWLQIAFHELRTNEAEVSATRGKIFVVKLALKNQNISPTLLCSYKGKVQVVLCQHRWREESFDVLNHPSDQQSMDHTRGQRLCRPPISCTARLVPTRSIRKVPHPTEAATIDRVYHSSGRTSRPAISNQRCVFRFEPLAREENAGLANNTCKTLVKKIQGSGCSPLCVFSNAAS